MDRKTSGCIVRWSKLYIYPSARTGPWLRGRREEGLKWNAVERRCHVRFRVLMLCVSSPSVLFWNPVPSCVSWLPLPLFSFSRRHVWLVFPAQFVFTCLSLTCVLFSLRLPSVLLVQQRASALFLGWCFVPAELFPLRSDCCSWLFDHVFCYFCLYFHPLVFDSFSS